MKYLNLFIFLSKIVGIKLRDETKLNANCSFQSLQQKQKDSRSQFYITINLPLTKRGYKYQFYNQVQTEQETFANFKWFLSHELKMRIHFLQKHLEMKSGVSNNMIISSFVNDLKRIAIPKNDYEQRNYIKNILKNNLGQQLVGGDTDIEDDITVRVQLNDFFPSVEYEKQRPGRRGQTLEDKNIPVAVTLFQLTPACGRRPRTARDLVILSKFASSGLMRTREDTPWVTLTPVISPLTL